MDSDSKNLMLEVFLEAARMDDSHARAAYLEQACGDNRELRRRVEKLLAAEARAGGPPPEALSSAQINSDPALGTHVGHYKLLQQIGEGGCGVVFMAEQEQPIRRKVALKVIKLGMDTKQVVARFEAERQALAMMDHPNIARVFDAGATDSGRPYFVMELVRGIKITDYCDQHQFSTRHRLDLFVQVCHAVQHAHQKGIIHRDLKPSNILVTELDGVPLPKIIDFGIAKAVEGRLTDRTLFTAFEQFIGTPAYMSPEQAALAASDIDTRSDIYSLGVLLYELLTGKTPFETRALLAAGLDALRQTIREREPLRPSTRLRTLQGAELTTTARSRGTEVPRLVHLIRGDLDWIVMKCLEKDRNRRYETANGLATDIRRHLDNEPVLARPPSRLYEFQKSVRRHKLGFAATAVVVLVLIAGVLASSWEASRARQSARLAHYRAYVSDMRVARDALGEGDLGRARRLLRRYIPEPGDETDLRQWEWRELAYECRPDQHFSLGPFPQELTNVKFLNQDTLLTTTLFTDRTYLWNWKEQRLARVLTNAQERVVGPAAFSPVRHGMFWCGGMSGDLRYVRFTDLQTGLETNVSFLGKVVVWPVAISPDERLLAVCRQDNGQGRVEVWDLEHQTNVVRLSMSRLPARFRVRFSPDGTRLAATDVAGRLSLWKVGQWSLVARTNAHWASLDVAALEFSPNSKWIVTGGTDWKVKIYDAHSGSFLRELHNPGHSDVFAFSPDSTILATSGVDRDIKLWDTSTWKIKRVLRGHTDGVVQLDFSPDGCWLASGSIDGEVNVWPLANSAPTLDRVRRFGRHAIDTYAAPDGTSFVRRLDPQGKEFEICRAPGFEPVAVRALAVPGATRRSAILLAGSVEGVAGYSDGRLRLFSFSGGLHWQTTSKETGPTDDLKASLDGTTLVSFAVVKPQWDRTSVSIWRLPGLELITNRVVDGAWFNAAVSDDARHLALYAGNGMVEVWDIPSLQGHPPWRVSGRARSLTAMRFSPDGKLLATACSDGSNYIWDYADRRAITALPVIRANISSFSFSSDSARLAVGALDGIRLFDVNTGEEMAALSDPELYHVKAMFSRNGRDLTAFGSDGVRVWHAPPLEEISSDWLKPETRQKTSNQP